MVEDINAYHHLNVDVTHLFTGVVGAWQQVQGRSVFPGERSHYRFPWSEKAQSLLIHPGYVFDDLSQMYVLSTPPTFDQEMVMNLTVNGHISYSNHDHYHGRLDTFVCPAYYDCVLAQSDNPGSDGFQRLGTIVEGNGKVYTDSPFFREAISVNGMNPHFASLHESRAILRFLQHFLLDQTKYLSDRRYRG